jgi:hypothetical protein
MFIALFEGANLEMAVNTDRNWIFNVAPKEGDI